MALRQAPCIYTFCGGNCALFSANGYRLLLNGGDDDESVFWRYVTHVPRLDAILGIFRVSYKKESSFLVVCSNLTNETLER